MGVPQPLPWGGGWGGGARISATACPQRIQPDGLPLAELVLIPRHCEEGEDEAHLCRGGRHLYL